jgi:hypothetical protein
MISDRFYKPWIRFVFQMQDITGFSDRSAVRLIRAPLRLTWRGSKTPIRRTAGRRHPR